jgi:molecular chaperone Hsp33
MLKMLGRTEIDAIVAERDAVEVQCEFCATPYRFDAVDAARLFVNGPNVPGSSSHH